MSVPMIELVAHLTTYIRLFHRSTDGSLTLLRTVLHDQCENSAVTNVVRFVSNSRMRCDIVEWVLSFRYARLPPSYALKLWYGAQKVVAETADKEFLQMERMKLAVNICYTLDVVYDEDVAMRLAEMESEEEAARRRVKVAVGTMLEEKEWEGDMGGGAGTCTICLEEFGIGEKVARMPCSHNFHKGCIWKWLVEECNSCPLCRCVVE